MQEIRVIINRSSEITREGSGDYDNDDLHWDWSVEGYTTDLTEWGENAHVRDVSGSIYAVVVSYDDGDSFHRETNRHCFVDAFSDESLAEALAKKINLEGRDGSPIQYINDDGKSVITACGTWSGYFENFNCVSVEHVLPKTRRYF
jgi:hypothetical protein